LGEEACPWVEVSLGHVKFKAVGGQSSRPFLLFDFFEGVKGTMIGHRRSGKVREKEYGYFYFFTGRGPPVGRGAHEARTAGDPKRDFRGFFIISTPKNF